MVVISGLMAYGGPSVSHRGIGMESGVSSGDSTLQGVSASQRAEELRASLGTRRDVEALLAEASAARRTAAADADAIVEEAQQLSEQLLAESTAEAERTTSRAR